MISLRYSIWLPLLAAIFFFGQSLSVKPSLQNRTDFLAPPMELKYLTAGFTYQASDSYWLRAVQDFDFCDKAKNKDECTGKSWLFNVINLVVELDKKFLEAYYYGALALTIIISDYDGASVIFDKGVAEFDQWQLSYAAAYHAYFNEKDKLKASKLYLRAVDKGAPDWVRLTAGRLAGEGGDMETAKIILQQLIDLKIDPAWIEILRKKISAMDK